MTARVDAPVEVSFKGDGTADWVSGKYYYKGALVTVSGALYCALVNTGFSVTSPADDSTRWVALSAS